MIKPRLNRSTFRSSQVTKQTYAMRRSCRQKSATQDTQSNATINQDMDPQAGIYNQLSSEDLAKLPFFQWRTDELQPYVKELEFESMQVSSIPFDKPYLVRLDGSCFTTFTKGLKSPFDMYFVKAMVCTCNDMVHKFGATSGYCQSDEITLIFQESDNQQVQQFRGRVFKLLSTAAGFASARFNYHICRYILPSPEYSDQVKEDLRHFNKFFDCRILIPREPVDIMKHMYWRSVGDCSRNAVSSFARKMIPKHRSTNMKQPQMLDMMRRRGLNWNTDVPFYLKNGVWSKRILLEVSGYNPVLKQDVSTVRRKIANFTCHIKRLEYWEWVLAMELSDLSVAKPLGMNDPDILEVVESGPIPPPIVENGQIVPQQV